MEYLFVADEVVSSSLVAVLLIGIYCVVCRVVRLILRCRLTSCDHNSRFLLVVIVILISFGGGLVWQSCVMSVIDTVVVCSVNLY